MYNMYLVTDSFPYGKGEKSFIMPELPYLTAEYKVTILTKASPEEIRDEKNKTELEDGVEVIKLNASKNVIQKMSSCIMALFNRWFWKEVVAIIKERRYILKNIASSFMYLSRAIYDYKKIVKLIPNVGMERLICYTYWYTPTTIAFLLYKKKQKNTKNIKVVTRVHGYDLYNERTKYDHQPFRKVVTEELDGVFLVNQECYHYFINRFLDRKNNSNCYVCRLGVKASERHFNCSRDTVFRLVSCSNVIELKRINLIIQALEILPDEIELEWLHFGGGDSMQYLVQMSSQLLSKKENIHYEWKGYLDNEDIIGYYQNHRVDCFITTSATEGCPISIQEALSFGIPIIGTNVGGIPETIENNGILISAMPQPAEIADAIKTVYYLPEEIKKEWSANSYKLWMDYFNADENAKKFVGILNALV